MHIAQGLAHARKVAGTHQAVVCGDTRYTWEEFEQRTDALARGLASLGVLRGDRVAVLMLNCHRYLELYYACARMGAVIVPLNIRLARPEIIFIRGRTPVVLLCMDAQHTKHVSQFVRCLFFVFLLVSSGFLNELLKPIVIQVSTVLPFLPALLSHPDFQEGIQDGVRIFQEGLFWEDHEKVWTEDEIITYIGEELSEEKYRREQRIDQVMGQPSLSYLYHLGFAISYLDQALAAQAQEGTVSEERQTHVVVLPEETCTVGRLCRTYPQRMARGRETVPSLSRANDMQQIITAKLKLLTTPEQLQALRETHLAYRDALNAVSSYAFEHGKTSNVTKLHKGMYAELRARYHLPSQLACSVERQVAATYKGLWTKLKKNVEHRNLERTYQHPLPGL